LNADEGQDIVFGGKGSDTIDGGSGADTLYGDDDNDIIFGGVDADVIFGGRGDDTLTGGTGVGDDAATDTFVWQVNEQGTASQPFVDTITDFSTLDLASGGDVLNLADLLQGEESSALTDFLNISYDSGTNTSTISVDHSGGSFFQPTQTIVLTDVDLTANGVFTTDQEILNNLINNGNLVVD